MTDDVGVVVEAALTETQVVVVVVVVVVVHPTVINQQLLREMWPRAAKRDEGEGGVEISDFRRLRPCHRHHLGPRNRKTPVPRAFASFVERARGDNTGNPPTYVCRSHRDATG